ncbi:MAG: HTH domain-containing protein [Planctomycetales bacterium]|nr:HTH domain-containing protein [Planctomycetales bacterium]
MNEDPITLWIDELRHLDDSAAEKLWQHFMLGLLEAAKTRLNPNSRRVYDEEDAAQSAFHSVCAGIRRGRFPDLHDRRCLWSLLLKVTALKVAQRVRYDHRQRRDVRRSLTDSVFANATNSENNVVDRLPSREPSPEFAAEFVEVCELLFQRLKDPSLQSVAMLRIEGFTDTEIAEKLTCSRRTVQRRVEAIRRHWECLEPNLE